jgi:hypothetical protein
MSLQLHSERQHRPNSIPKPSDEQHKILNAVKRGCSIIIDAVAGSGKSTTVLQIAQMMSEKRILQITYNKSLKDEVRKSAEAHSLMNLEVHSYHSLGYKYYSADCARDKGIIAAIHNMLPNKVPRMQPFDIIIIDECQDMTPMLYQLSVKFYIDNLIAYCNLRGNTDWNRRWRPQMIFMGDRYQCVYEFRSADSRFLTLADYCWRRYVTPAYNPYDISSIPKDASLPAFERHTLSVSYRLTVQLTDFVNISLMHNKRIVAANDRQGPKVYLYSGANAEHSQAQSGYAFKAIIKVGKRIKHLLLVEQSLKPSDIIVLMPTTKTRPGKQTPWIKLANDLTHAGIPIYTSRHEDDQPTNAVSNGKVIFTTFHSAKGLGRRFVVLFNMTTYYFLKKPYCAPNFDCTNDWYVAATRCKQEMHVIAGDMGDEIQFLYLPKDCYHTYVIVSNPQCIADRVFQAPQDRARHAADTFIMSKYRTFETDVTALVSHLPIELLTQLEPLVDSIMRIKAGCEIRPTQLRSEVDSTFTSLIESVAIINSHAVMDKWEARLSKTSATLRNRLINDDFRNKDLSIGPKDAGPLSERMNKKYVEYFAPIQKSSPNHNEYGADDHISDADDIIVFNPDELPADYYLHLSALYDSESTELLYIYKQLPSFTWMSDEELNHCLANAERAIPPLKQYLVEFSATNCRPIEKHKAANGREPRSGTLTSATKSDISVMYRTPNMPNVGIRINGRYDLVTCDFNNITTIWEFKVINKLDITHKLQILIYAYLSYLSSAFNPNHISGADDECVPANIFDDKLYNIANVKKKVLDTHFNLLNLRDGELFEMFAPQEMGNSGDPLLIRVMPTLRQIVDTLLEYKINSNIPLDDDQFRHVIEEYSQPILSAEHKLKKITCSTLRSKAREIGLIGFSSMKKADLISGLQHAMSEADYNIFIHTAYSSKITSAANNAHCSDANGDGDSENESNISDNDREYTANIDDSYIINLNNDDDDEPRSVDDMLSAADVRVNNMAASFDGLLITDTQ